MDYQERASQAQAVYQMGLDRVRTTPPPANQKFLPGTFVKIAEDLGPSMAHFTSGVYARVEYTYSHAYSWGGSENVKDYSLLVRFKENKWSSVAWYHEHQLEEVTDKDLIEKFKEELG